MQCVHDCPYTWIQQPYLRMPSVKCSVRPTRKAIHIGVDVISYPFEKLADGPFLDGDSLCYDRAVRQSVFDREGKQDGTKKDRLGSVLF